MKVIKITAVFVTFIALSGCDLLGQKSVPVVSNEGEKQKIVPMTKPICIDGIAYLMFPNGGASVRYRNDGQIATCSK